MTRKKLAQFGSNADYSFSIVLEKKKVVSRLRIDLLLPQDFDLDRRLRNAASKQSAPDTRKKKKN